MTIRRSRNKKKKKASLQTITSNENQDGNKQTNGIVESVFFSVIVCFFLSGFAALLYQTAWLRQFSIVFGTSELAVVTVLAAYMGGLSAGAALAGRFIGRITRPVFVYGLLEAGIALSALAVPVLLSAASFFYNLLLGGQPQPPQSVAIGQTVYYLVISFLILAFPTGFMGATLPLLTRYAVRSDRQVGPRVALLYAVNTAGAVVGTVSAGFLLLPLVGLYWTVSVGIGANILVFLIAITIAKSIPPASLTKQTVDELKKRKEELPVSFLRNCIRPLFDHSRSLKQRLPIILHNQPGWILPVILISGANAFLYEVLWTRLITHVLGGSVYAFATMLASFLTGIAIGSSIAGKCAENRDKAATYFALAQVCISLFSILVYTYIQQLVPDKDGYLENALFAAMVMLPSTVFIGATFPLAVRILSRGEQDVGECSARVYAWNTLGAIAGAIIAGFYLIPSVGFPGAIKFAAALNITLAIWVLITISRPLIVETAGVFIALVALLYFYQPSTPSIVLNSSLPDDIEEEKKIIEHYFAVGRSSTVLLTEQDGWFNLRTNGLPESSVNYRGAPPINKSMQWLTTLPLIMRPQASSMLVVGFGGGVALESVPDTIEAIDVVELEPEIINANRIIGSVRPSDPLGDPRVKVIINDARNALQLTSKRYDVIVSQPSHPWTAGASHLYTREFLQLANTHLTEGGVFLQWMNSRFVDKRLLRTLSATVLDVFPYVRLYHPQPEVLLFIASNQPINVETTAIRSGKISNYLARFSNLGLNSVEDLLAILAVDEKGLRQFASGAQISTDNNNFMAMHSRHRGDGLSPTEVMEMLAPFDPLLDDESWIHHGKLYNYNFSYIALRLLQRKLQVRANLLAKVITDKSTLLLIHALGLRSQDNNNKAYKFLKNAIKENPFNAQARFALLEYYLRKIADDNAPEGIELIAESMQGTAAAVIEGWTYSINDDFVSLAQLDDQLSQANVTDLWYQKALQLRAEWRVMSTSSGNRQQNLLDALHLIDRALILQPGISLFALRARCAFLLKDPELFIETMRFLVSAIDKKISQSIEDGDKFSRDYLIRLKTELMTLNNDMNSAFVKPVEQRKNQIQAELYEVLNKIEGEI